MRSLGRAAAWQQVQFDYTAVTSRVQPYLMFLSHGTKDCVVVDRSCVRKL